MKLPFVKLPWKPILFVILYAKEEWYVLILKSFRFSFYSYFQEHFMIEYDKYLPQFVRTAISESTILKSTKSKLLYCHFRGFIVLLSLILSLSIQFYRHCNTYAKTFDSYAPWLKQIFDNHGNQVMLIWYLTKKRLVH